MVTLHVLRCELSVLLDEQAHSLVEIQPTVVHDDFDDVEVPVARHLFRDCMIPSPGIKVVSLFVEISDTCAGVGNSHYRC